MNCGRKRQLDWRLTITLILSVILIGDHIDESTTLILYVILTFIITAVGDFNEGNV